MNSPFLLITLRDPINEIEAQMYQCITKNKGYNKEQRRL